MSEKIIRIEEAKDKDHGAGYNIITDKQIVKMMISDYQDCCESWGYLISEDKFDQFIGADLLEITITDKALQTIKFDEYCGPEDMDAGGMMFVNINTSNGLLQFVAYNAHNGYYGHTACVISEQLKHEESL